MNILLDNVNPNSSSGPNSFGKRLAVELVKRGHSVNQSPEPDVQLSFIVANQKLAPLALRLDGIYFNTRQDWEKLNDPIKRSFEIADLVIYQSEFNRRLTEKFFGKPKKSVVINNGTCYETISKIPKAVNPILDKFSEIWCCASSWRPHKRLKDNVNYFFQHAPSTACLIVIGENPDYQVQDPRVFYTGQISWENCISLYKSSKVFIHLAFLDHCPNVVVDARACGCEIIAASSGGTKEILPAGAKIVNDLDWDMRPLDLYSPPALDFSSSKNEVEKSVDIKDTATSYIEALEQLRIKK